MCISFALSLAPVPALADIYKHVDAKGHIHLADRPLHKGYKLWRSSVKKSRKPKSRAVAKNRAKFMPMLQRAAQKHRLNVHLLDAVVMTESAYDPEAISKAGAVGLMQLMPATAKHYGVNNRNDPGQNIDGGSRYLRHLLDRYEGDLRLALAAYNAGETAVDRYGKTIPPFKETRNYVRKVIERYRQKQQAG